MNNPTSTLASRSGFITGLAWTFIGLGGFATLIAVLQNIMLALAFPVDEMRSVMAEADKTHPMPGVFRFMFDNFRLFFASFLALSALTLVSAIGLLKRKNWARLLFVAIMAIGLLWNLAGLAMPFFMSSWLPAMPDTAPADFRDQFDLMWKIMTAFTVLIALVFAGLFGWVIKRLVSEDIKREFLAL
jgi:hypothetical protein